MSIRSAPDEHPMVAAGKQVEDREMTVLRNVEGDYPGCRYFEKSKCRNVEERQRSVEERQRGVEISKSRWEATECRGEATEYRNVEVLKEIS